MLVSNHQICSNTIVLKTESEEILGFVDYMTVFLYYTIGTIIYTINTIRMKTQINEGCIVQKKKKLSFQVIQMIQKSMTLLACIKLLSYSFSEQGLHILKMTLLNYNTFPSMDTNLQLIILYLHLNSLLKTRAELYLQPELPHHQT